MYKFKIEIDGDSKELAGDLKRELGESCTISVFDSKGLLGSEAVVIAIIAAAPGIITTIATVVQAYLKRNNDKSVSFENSNGKRTYSGYTLKEIKELEAFLTSDAPNQ